MFSMGGVGNVHAALDSDGEAARMPRSAGERAGRAEVKRRRDARGGAKLFHLFDDEHFDWFAMLVY
jgi:hypothetical protein